MKKEDLERLWETNACPNGDLYGSQLNQANLCGADLCEADLGFANLCGADLSYANLRRANLRGGVSWMGQISGALTWEVHNSSQQNHDKDIFNSSNLPKAQIPMGFLDLLTPPDVVRALRLST